MSRTTLILSAVCALVAATGCTDDTVFYAEGADCGHGSEAVDGLGTRVCIFVGDILIEEGFECPRGVPHQHEYHGGVVCSEHPDRPLLDEAEAPTSGGGDNGSVGDLGTADLAYDVDLADADVTFVGGSYGLVGGDVAFVGDVDQDGFDDLLVADRDFHRETTEGLQRVGGAYLVYGRDGLVGEAPLTSEVVLAYPDYRSIEPSVSGLGDVDGDGFHDLALGRGYLVAGGARLQGVVSLARTSTDLTPGHIEDWEIVAGGGDLDGDEYDDVAVASWSEGTGGRVSIHYGRAHLLDGSETPAEQADATLREQPDRRFISDVAMGGDFDGDGHADMLVGCAADGTPGSDGVVYLVYGGPQRLAGELELEGFPHFRSTTSRRPTVGIQAVWAGDLDGDDRDEIAIGDPFGEGYVYVISGRSDRLTGEVALEQAGFVYVGNHPDANLGMGLGAGDVNGDGFGDLLVGTPNPVAAPGGSTFVLLGEPNRLEGRWSSQYFDTRLDGRVDTLNGSDVAGYRVASGGDFNGDGVDDIAIGAPGTIIGDEYGGRVYLRYGRR